MSVRTASQIVSVLRDLMPELERKFRVRELSLFGSYARGEQRDGSDVDLLVDVDPSIGLEYVSLAEELERALGLPVDLISVRGLRPRHLEAIRPDLVHV